MNWQLGGNKGRDWGRAGYLGVNHGPSSSQIVGCGAGGGRHYEAIPLDMGHEVTVAEALQVAQEGGHASVNHHLIQHDLLIQVSIVVCK